MCLGGVAGSVCFVSLKTHYCTTAQSIIACVVHADSMTCIIQFVKSSRIMHYTTSN